MLFGRAVSRPLARSNLLRILGCWYSCEAPPSLNQERYQQPNLAALRPLRRPRSPERAAFRFRFERLPQSALPVSPSLTRFTTAFLLSSEVEQWSCQLGKKRPSRVEPRDDDSNRPILSVFSARGDDDSFTGDVSACNSSIQPGLSHCTKTAREMKNQKLFGRNGRP